MNNRARRKEKPKVRCAIYTRKSTDEGLDREFNTLDAQRESAEAYIASQRQEGWLCLMQRYDDGGYTGGNMQRPALKRLMGCLTRLDAIENGDGAAAHPALAERVETARRDFAEKLEQDLNVPGALGVMFELVRHVNTAIDDGELTQPDAARVAFATIV